MSTFFTARKALNTLRTTGIVAITAVVSLSPLAAQAQESYTGNIVGGVAGALLGSRIGGGNGKIAATAAGGIIGAIVGGNVERGSSYRQNYGVSQQAYPTVYQQPAPRYQRDYTTETYSQPIYAEPVYERQTYVYARPQPTYVYAQPYFERRAREDHDRDWYERHGRYEQHRTWHQDHDRHDDDRYDR